MSMWSGQRDESLCLSFFCWCLIQLDLSKYVHLNPVKAGIVAFPEDYLWSSYRAYLQKEESPLIEKHQILSYFPNPYFNSYESFIKSPVIDLSNMEAELFGQK
jgi:hypothetical protein